MESSQMARRRHNRRCLKICCGVTAIIIVIIVIVSVTLAFTVFKPEDPEINARTEGTQSIRVTLFPKLSVNATFDMEVTIKNPNYGSLEFAKTIANLDYHGDIVAKFPMGSHNVPARGQVSLRVLVSVMGDKIVSNPFLMGDVGLGSLNFTSDSALLGEVSVWNLLKFKATAYNSCNISVFLATQNVISSCKSSLQV